MNVAMGTIHKLADAYGYALAGIPKSLKRRRQAAGTQKQSQMNCRSLQFLNRDRYAISLYDESGD